MPADFFLDENLDDAAEDDQPEDTQPDRGTESWRNDEFPRADHRGRNDNRRTEAVSDLVGHAPRMLIQAADAGNRITSWGRDNEVRSPPQEQTAATPPEAGRPSPPGPLPAGLKVGSGLR